MSMIKRLCLAIIVILILEPRISYGQTLPVHCNQAYIRGDANNDGGIDLSDPVYLLMNLFLGSGQMPCLEQGDANTDSAINIADPVFLLNYLFLQGPAPNPAMGEAPDVPPDLWLSFFYENADDTIPIPNVLMVGDRSSQSDIAGCEIQVEKDGNSYELFASDWGPETPEKDYSNSLTSNPLLSLPIGSSMDEIFEDYNPKTYTIDVQCQDEAGNESTLTVDINGVPATPGQPWCYYGDTWSDQCCQRTDGVLYCIADLDQGGPQRAPDCEEPTETRAILTCCPAGADCYVPPPVAGGGGAADPYSCYVDRLTVLLPSDGMNDYIKKEFGGSPSAITTPGLQQDVGNGPLGHVEASGKVQTQGGAQEGIHVGYGFIVYAKLRPGSQPQECAERQFAQGNTTKEVNTVVGGQMTTSDETTSRQIKGPDNMWVYNDVIKNRRVAEYNSKLVDEPQLKQSTVEPKMPCPDCCAVGSNLWCNDNYGKPYALKKHIPGDIPKITWYDLPGQKFYLEAGQVPKSKFKSRTHNFITIVEDKGQYKDPDGITRYHRWYCNVGAQPGDAKTTQVKVENTGNNKPPRMGTSTPSCTCKNQKWDEAGKQWIDVMTTGCGPI